MSNLASPCVAICELDVTKLFCEGCGRSTEEIAQWRSADDVQKTAILVTSRERLAANSECP